MIHYYLYKTKDFELNSHLLNYQIDADSIQNITRIGVSLMTYNYQQDNKGEQDKFDETAWAPLEKFFIFLIFATKEHIKVNKKVFEKVLPLFDFI